MGWSPASFSLVSDWDVRVTVDDRALSRSCGRSAATRAVTAEHERLPLFCPKAAAGLRRQLHACRSRRSRRRLLDPDISPAPDRTRTRRHSSGKRLDVDLNWGRSGARQPAIQPDQSCSPVIVTPNPSRCVARCGMADRAAPGLAAAAPTRRRLRRASVIWGHLAARPRDETRIRHLLVWSRLSNRQRQPDWRNARCRALKKL
jgi:hypothetical protein